MFGALYDGGDFCRGLIYSKIATKTAMDFAEYFRYVAFMKEYSNPPEHMIEKFNKKSRRCMVITHRGNDFGPENSMKALYGTIDNLIEGIEADVSRTSSC